MPDRIDKPVGKGDEISFRYLNWRNEEHEYCVKVESISIGTYDAGGMHTNLPLRPDNLQFVLHAEVMTRDGVDRPARRTFIVGKIRDIKV
jgi:hypothetical protein